MNLKKLFLIFILLFCNFSMVNAATLEENLADLNDKVDALWSQIDLEPYPVGSIYITTSSTSPVTLFGGTWEIYATDKQLIGVGSNGTTTYTADGTGGNSSVSLALANMTAHTHSLTASGSVTSTFTGSSATTSSAGGHTHEVNANYTTLEVSGYGMQASSYYTDLVMVSGGSTTTSSSSFSTSSHSVTPSGTVKSTFTGSSATSTSVGSGTSFSIQNPYVTVYMWKRTS